MATSTLLWALIQAWSLCGMLTFAQETCMSGTGTCPDTPNSIFNDDQISFLQEMIGFKQHGDPRHLKNHRWSSKSAALHLKKEHIWALSADTLVGENVNEYNDIADRTMLAVFGDTLRHLSKTQQTNIKKTFRSAGRTNHTRLREMMSTACFLDDWKEQGFPHFTIPAEMKDMLVSAGILKDDKDLPADKSTDGTASAEEKKGPLTQKAIDQMGVAPSCRDFSGRWRQDAYNAEDPSDPCTEYSVDAKQDGCFLTATSDEAWWKEKNVSLNVIGNELEIQLSNCGNLFKGVLSDDGQTIKWNSGSGCTWYKVPSYFEGARSFVSRHAPVVAVGILLLGFVGGVMLLWS